MSIPSLTGPFVINLDDRDPSHFKLLSERVGPDNAHSFALLSLAWISLLADSPCGHMSRRVINRFATDLLDDPISTLRLHSDLLGAFLEGMNCPGDAAFIGSVMKLFSRSPLHRDVKNFFTDHDPLLCRYIISFLEFGKKVPYKNTELDSIALSSWKTVEQRLASLTIPNWACNLKTLLAFLFKDLEDMEFLPKHGSGSVSEMGIKGIGMKNLHFTVDKKIQYLYMRHGSTLSSIDVSDYYLPFLQKSAPIDRGHTPARLMFVPKSWKTSRSICMEPIGFQWAQQSVRCWLEDFLERSRLKNHVVISDQAVNQSACFYGSVTHEASTIDLSAASDSVSYSLVKAIFPPRVLKHLVATRSRSVALPDGEVRVVHKFSPMGSATCFPVQSIIYSCIVALVDICTAYGLDWKVPGILNNLDLSVAWEYCYGVQDPYDYSSQFFPFKVYGDDIVCDHITTSNIMEALSLLGFEVNPDKSYYGDHPFRESCGVYAFLGEDVTPLRYSVQSFGEVVSVGALGSAIDFANRARSFGYGYAYRAVLAFCMYYDVEGIFRAGGKNPVLFSNNPDDSFTILTDEPRNDHLVKRSFSLYRAYSCDTRTHFQRSEVLSIHPTPSKRVPVDHQGDNYYYLRWWASRYRDREISGDQSESIMTADVLSTDVGWRWTAIP